jgi:serine/threonine protein kinase
VANLNFDADSGRIGPYRVLSRLGRGGLGHIHLAESPGGRIVALKVLDRAVADDPFRRSVLAQEARATARVDSPFTARLIDADTDGPVPWLASEYFPGPTLRQLVTASGPLSMSPLLALAAALAEGLRDIHAAGVVHRDLKPSNVILAPDRPRIIDFGLAAWPEPEPLTDRDVVVGTPGYMPPEQARGKRANPASDIFALGAVLTFAVAGRAPFGGGNPSELLYRTVAAEPDLADVPEMVRPLIASCLAKDPAQRPQAAALREDTYDLAEVRLGLDADALRDLMGTIAEFDGRRGRSFRPEPEARSVALIDRSVSGWKAWRENDHYDPGEDDYDPGEDATNHDDGWRSLESGTEDSGHSGAGGYGGGGSGAVPGDEEEPRPRFLTGILPERAPAGARISLLVQITLTAVEGASAAVRRFPVSPTGSVATITVSAPGLIPLGDLEQDLTVPFAADSAPVRFGFLAGPVGLHPVQIRAFAGGTYLGELALEISVEIGVALEEGRSRTAPMAELAAEPGEVTLQVSRTATGGYSFQLLSEAFYPVVIIDRLAADPAAVVGQMVAELRGMSKGTSQYATPALARRRLRSLGSQLWADMVPATIREQFWAQRDKIKLFTIASDMDTVPWELLYPVDLDNDDGFLVEQFPVVRRVYGQGRARVLRLDRGAGFIVPPKAPVNAMDEVAAVRAALPAHVTDRGTQNGLGEVLELLDAVPSVLHFAGHNAFTDEMGSLISLAGGPLRPGDLSYARQRRAFESVRPLVFLNGCRTAGEISGFTQLVGWAKEFMGAGAGAFIGSLWAVRSTSARTFAEKFYGALVGEGESLGVASLRARQAIAADEGDPTWLAYTVYGNPSASVMRDPEPAPWDVW